MRTLMFVLLILLSPLTLLISFSNPSSVNSTNVTAERTTTATYTSTAFDTSYASITGSMIVQIPVNIPPQGVGFMVPQGKCSQFTMPLTVTSGTTINLEITSTNPANLYLLPSETYRTSPNGCTLIGNSLMAENNFTSYRLRWNATDDGTLFLLLTGPNTIIIVRDHGSSKAVQQLATTTYANTETYLNAYSSVTIANFTTSTTVPSSSQSNYPPPLRFELSLVACVAALLGSMLSLTSRKSLVRFRVTLTETSSLTDYDSQATKQ